MKKLSLYAVVLSSCLLSGGAMAINDGNGHGGRDGLQERADRGSVSGGSAPMMPIIVEEESFVSFEAFVSSYSTTTSDSDSTSEASGSADGSGSTGAEADGTTRQGTGTEEGAASFGVAGDVAAGVPEYGIRAGDGSPDPADARGIGRDFGG